MPVADEEEAGALDESREGGEANLAGGAEEELVAEKEIGEEKRDEPCLGERRDEAKSKRVARGNLERMRGLEEEVEASKKEVLEPLTGEGDLARISVFVGLVETRGDLPPRVAGVGEGGEARVW